MCWEKNDNSRPLWNGFGVKRNVLLLIGVVVLEHHTLLKIFQSHTHHSYDFKWISLLSCLSTFSNLMKSHPPFLMFKQISIHLNYIFNFRTRLCNSERNGIGLLVFYGLFIFYFFLYFISYRLVRKVLQEKASLLPWFLASPWPAPPPPSLSISPYRLIVHSVTTLSSILSPRHSSASKLLKQNHSLHVLMLGWMLL